MPKAVRNDAQLKQLTDQVARHPGSPAFAVLAEHHLAENDLQLALEVAQEGFGANPGYVRGAIVYLKILRRLRKVQKAGEAFRRAAAYQPHSANLRLQWALVLAE